MSDKSKIEWTDASWNPVRGCTKVSAGCKNCYAETFAERWRGVPGHPFEQGFDLRLVPEKLSEPLKWRRPRRIFVNSMSDLFHEDVPFEFIDSVFSVMALCPRHTFQVLTKRPERMREYVSDFYPEGGRLEQMLQDVDGFLSDRMTVEDEKRLSCVDVLPNVWLGVSCEDQATADERIPELLKTPAAVRFLSCEPLLGPVEIGVPTEVGRSSSSRENPFDTPIMSTRIPRGINWVIVGGESGTETRACNVQWVRSIVSRCRCSAVPVFVKQLGRRPYDLSRIDAVPGNSKLFTREEIAIPEHAETAGRILGECMDAAFLKLRHPKGGDMSEWPPDLQVREWPEASGSHAASEGAL